jgi:hypothetical protein
MLGGPLLRAGSRPSAARHEVEEAMQRGQGLQVPASLGVAAAVLADRAAPDGVARGAVPLADSAHAPAPAPRRSRAAARAAPDGPRVRQGEGGRRCRQGGSVGRRPRAVQVTLFVGSDNWICLPLLLPVHLAVVDVSIPIQIFLVSYPVAY